MERVDIIRVGELIGMMVSGYEESGPKVESWEGEESSQVIRRRTTESSGIM